jgi:hypothetical protein
MAATVYAVVGRTWTIQDFHDGASSPTFFQTFQVQRAQPNGMLVRHVMGSFDPAKPLSVDRTFLSAAQTEDPLFWLPEGAQLVRVGESEQVTVPSGTFECTIVEFEIPGRRKSKIWASDKHLGLVVLQEREAYDDGTTLRVRSELTSFTEPKKPAPAQAQRAQSMPKAPAAPGIVVVGFFLVFLCAPLGAILCAVGLPEARRRKRGQGLAIAGIVLGILSVALLVLAAIIGEPPPSTLQPPDAGVTAPASTRPPPEAPAPSP